MDKNPIPDEELRKLLAVGVLLRDCKDPRVVAIARKADALASPGPEEAAMAKVSAGVQALQKADPTMTRSAALERVVKDDRGLARELHNASRGVAA